MSRADISSILTDAAQQGVREIAYTGGEPFLHAEMPEIISETLARFPTTVLTNGTRIRPPIIDRLVDAAEDSPYSLEIRVSLDSPFEEENDAIRGPGVYRRAIRAAALLFESGFLPIITAARQWDPDDDLEILDEFEARLRDAGIDKPRVKFLPTLKMGREVERTRGYYDDEIVTQEMFDLVGAEQFLCADSRLVTAKGVWVCPILVNDPAGRVGDTLADSNVPYKLDHGACYTCFQFGAICSNVSTSIKES